MGPLAWQRLQQGHPCIALFAPRAKSALAMADASDWEAFWGERSRARYGGLAELERDLELAASFAPDPSLAQAAMLENAQVGPLDRLPKDGKPE